MKRASIGLGKPILRLWGLIAVTWGAGWLAYSRLAGERMHNGIDVRVLFIGGVGAPHRSDCEHRRLVSAPLTPTCGYKRQIR